MGLAAQYALGPLVPTLANTRTIFELSRRHELTEWWQWWLLLIGSLLVAGYVGCLYHRDARELPRGVRWGLLLLRLTAFAGLLLYYFDLEKRTERQLTRPSRVAVLVDTSQSMGLTDSSPGPSRLQQVIDEFSGGTLLPELRIKHDVVVYRFDQTAAPQAIASFAKLNPTSSDDATSNDTAAIAAQRLARRLLYLAAALAALSLLMFTVQAWAGRRVRGAEGESYLLLAGTVGLIFSLVLAAAVNLRFPDQPLRQLWGTMPTSQIAAQTPTADPMSADESGISPPASPDPQSVDWSTELVPRGTETRLGEALRWVLDQERAGPLAGVVVVTDGRHNAGVTPDSVARVAESAAVPIYPIGLGSETQPRNVRIVDLESPTRVYPRDHFNLTGYIQADGLADRTVRVRLQQRTLEDRPTDPPLEMERRITLPADGQMVPVQFEVTPEQTGRFRWQMEVIANSTDDLDTRDNQRSSVVEVIERRTRVLLLAGGPTRDYHFLHTVLFRDPTTEVDVRLQSAPPGAAQEATRILTEFPTDRDEMFEYDCLVAFDPNWAELTEEQVRLIDEWVAEKAGGLILIAGPVYTPSWTRGTQGDDSKLSLLRDLYPVTFYRSGAATIQLGRVGSETAWPLQFTDEGRRAQFLWLDDAASTSEKLWSDFPGVFGYQALRGIKPGAQVYARFSDPQAATSDERPIYMAGQFFGAGRVFYLGSGEMWRLNELDPSYFATFYTKLIRHVSQGRLLRDSSRGVLLVDNERCSLGDTITVRAVLADLNYQPLTVDSVPAAILLPDGTRSPLSLKRLPTAERPGMYSAQVTATQPGDYRIELAIPDVDNELLTREVKVRLPALEIESPQRNDALLSALASQTAGQYFVGLSAARGEQGLPPLPNQLRAKDQVTYVPGTPDPAFESTLMTWLLALICGALCLEWLIRRLYKLA